MPIFRVEVRAVAKQHLDDVAVACKYNLGINFFILDLRRVLAPASKVLGAKHISNLDCVYIVLTKRKQSSDVF